MAKSKARFQLTKETETAARTVWRAKWIYPPMSGKCGSTYFATTYPESALIYLETGAKRRHVGNGVATRILPIIRAALQAQGYAIAKESAA